MPGSVASEDIEDEVEVSLTILCTLLILISKALIIDIESIQAHGKYRLSIGKLWLKYCRSRSQRYHETKSKWLLHSYGEHLSSLVIPQHDISQSVHAATRRALLKVKGFSEIKVEKIKEAIAKCQVCYIYTNDTVQHR